MNDCAWLKLCCTSKYSGGIIKKGGTAERTASFWKSNPLAHVIDVVRREEEVLKPLVAHLKHTGMARGEKGKTCKSFQWTEQMSSFGLTEKNQWIHWSKSSQVSDFKAFEHNSQWGFVLTISSCVPRRSLCCSWICWWSPLPFHPVGGQNQFKVTDRKRQRRRKNTFPLLSIQSMGQESWAKSYYFLLHWNAHNWLNESLVECPCLAVKDKQALMWLIKRILGRRTTVSQFWSRPAGCTVSLVVPSISLLSVQLVGEFSLNSREAKKK